MRNINKTHVTTAIMSAAAELATELGMERENNLTSIFEDQAIMLATSDGIQIGKVKIHGGESRTYRYRNYNLKSSGHAETQIFYYKYGITEWGWEQTPTFHLQLPSNAVIYTGGYYRG